MKETRVKLRGEEVEKREQIEAARIREEEKNQRKGENKSTGGEGKT